LGKNGRHCGRCEGKIDKNSIKGPAWGTKKEGDEKTRRTRTGTGKRIGTRDKGDCFCTGYGLGGLGKTERKSLGCQRRTQGDEILSEAKPHAQKDESKDKKAKKERKTPVKKKLGTKQKKKNHHRTPDLLGVKESLHWRK